MRELLNRVLAVIQLDNQFLIQAMLGAGMQVPDIVDDLGLVYRPPTLTEANSGRQVICGYRRMLENGYFACAEAAAWEAAVLSEKYKITAEAFVNPITGDGIFHALYRTSSGTIDPVARFLRQQTP